MVMLFAVAAALASAAPGTPDSVTRWRSYTDEAATRCGVPVAWIERVIRAESAGRTTLGGRPITSRAGAMGLMQLMPVTWAVMRTQLSLGTDPHDPRDNILAGACYLRLMYDNFGYPGLFAAYNAGPGRYADHLARGRPLPTETRAYLVKLVGAETVRPSNEASAPATIFFPLTARTMATTAPSATPGNGLFVELGRELPPR